MSKFSETRTSCLKELATELGVDKDTLASWIDQTTLIEMCKRGFNPFTMPRALPPVVSNYLRKRFRGILEEYK